MLSESLLVRRLGERGARIPAVLTPAAPDSTNTLAKTLARENPASPILIAADRQTAGRGRQGKTFISPPGGLYLSLLLPVNRPAADVVGVTSCAAVAVARAIGDCAGISVGIKWVNDITAEGGKLAGILCEAVGDGTLCRYLVTGVGINVTDAPKVDGAALPPVSLRDLGAEAEAEALAAAVADELAEVWENGFDFSRCADEYRARSVVLGKQITAVRGGETLRGTAEAIGDDGALLLRTGDGPIRLSSGEISVRL